MNSHDKMHTLTWLSLMREYINGTKNFINASAVKKLILTELRDIHCGRDLSSDDHTSNLGTWEDHMKAVNESSLSSLSPSSSFSQL